MVRGVVPFATWFPMTGKKIFADVKRAASLVGYIESACGGEAVKSGASLFINPSPCCGHKDCFSIFSPNKDGAQDAYRCHSCGAKGDVFTVATEIQGLKMGEALRAVAGFAGVDLPDRERPGASEPAREKTRAEYIAERCVGERNKAVEYLVEARKIDAEVAQKAALAGAVGWNEYRSKKIGPGERGHGGPALATIVRSLNPGHIMAVDLRFEDPALNGGIKTQTQGEKEGYGWTSDIRRLMKAETVFFCESAINALSIESARMPGKTAAFAIRGTGNAGNIPLGWMRGKQAVIVPDNDAPGDDGYCAGLKAAWVLHERLTGLDVACQFVDMADWGEPDEINDVNDLLKAEGPEALKRALWKLEPWLIAGMAGDGGREDLFSRKQQGRRRVYLPFHHDSMYWRFRVRPDFTSYVSEIKQNADDPDGAPKMDVKELAGFRVAAISRVQIQSATATMTGDEETMPSTRFSVSVQTTRHGATLLRRTVDDEKLHNIDLWKRFGPVWDQSKFLRMVNILENAAHIGARKAANFVGLCWKEGRLQVNEGPDCYFQEPEKQCPYHNLTFPTGTPDQGRKVIEAFQTTFGANAAAQLLVWALGGHLKTIIGFWPHMVLQADKGAGKSTLIKRMERAIAFTMLSGQSTQSDFRLLTSVSHTGHPVGWEEISARKQQVIDAAVALLQESYQYTVTRRGSEMTEYLLSAPVLLAGEDVPVVSLTGKIVRASLRIKGDLIPDDLPRFPVRAWLEWLAAADVRHVRRMYENTRERLMRGSRASGADNGAVRMVGNYAAIALAWGLLTEFCGMSWQAGDFIGDLQREMNEHIGQTSADRHPWVWIMERFAGELAAGRYQGPYCYDTVQTEAGGEEAVICLRTSDVMHHMQTTSALRDFWNSLPVKSDRVFKKQMEHAGVIVGEVERTIGNTMVRRRYSRLAAVSLTKLEGFGVYVHRQVDAEI